MEFIKLSGVQDLPEGVYHGHPALSSSEVRALIDHSPARIALQRKHPPPAGPAFIFGRAFHCLVLEPDKFDDQFVLNPYASARGNAAKGWIETQKQSGKTVISNTTGDDPIWQPGDYDRMHRMRDAVMSNRMASILLSDGWPERSYLWDETIGIEVGDVITDAPFECRARFDFVNRAHSLGVDLKTSQSADYKTFRDSIFRYGYHIQEHHYMRGARACNEPLTGFVFVCVSKSPPYEVNLFSLDDDSRSDAVRPWLIGATKFATAQATGQWGMFPDEIHSIHPWRSKA